MKIIKEGDLSKLHKVKQFRCLECGCIFEANDTEYVWYDSGMCYDSGFLKPARNVPESLVMP